MVKSRKSATDTARTAASARGSKHAKTSSSKTAPTNKATSASKAPSTISSRAPTPPLDEEEAEDEDGEAERQKKRQPFRFFDLAPEIRLQILEEALHITAYDVLALYDGKRRAQQICDQEERPDPPLDLEPSINWYLVRPRLNLFLVSRRMHDEAYRVFYAQPMRIYPLHGRFFHTKKPLLARIPPKYRAVVNTMEMRLGPGWSKPPRGQNTEPSLGLQDCTNLRNLKIFVEIDTSDAFFNGFRGLNATEETYTLFCVGLLRGIIDQVPSLKTVEIDANPGVKSDAPLVRAMRQISENAGKALVWGPLRKWEQDSKTSGLSGLENAMIGLGIAEEARLIEAQA